MGSIGCFPSRLLESVTLWFRQACLATRFLRQPANRFHILGDMVSMSPTRSSDPAFEELLLAWAERSVTTEHGVIGNWHLLIPCCSVVGCNAGRLRMESMESEEGVEGWECMLSERHCNR